MAFHISRRPAMTCLRSLRSSTSRTPLAKSIIQTTAYSTALRSSRTPGPMISSSSSAPTTTHITRRSNSSSSPSTAPTSGSTSSTSDVLTWNRFFDLRKKRRYINLGSSAVTAGTALLVLGPVIMTQDLDGWAVRMSGMDPFIVLGLSAFAVGAGGWMCGPSFGSAVFRAWMSRKGWTAEIAEKEKSFYARIKRYRADPSHSSIQNPVPDYYGEKVSSVKDYRRWLKDQRAFTLKKDKNIL